MLFSCVMVKQTPHGFCLRVSCVYCWIPQIAIKGCRDVCFSNGGHYFAAINGITVSIYNTYTCESLGNLRGHNGKVGAADVCQAVWGIPWRCCRYQHVTWLPPSRVPAVHSTAVN